MKSIVIVAPSFAPSSYPPAIRTRFFASHLSEFGWRPIVLTVRPEFLEEPQDPEFNTLLPKDLEVIRTAAIPQRLTREFGFGDLGLRSFPFHYCELSRLCHKGVDAILIPGPPWYPFCLGPMIGQRFRVPYILDYIDPWVESMAHEEKPSLKGRASRCAALVLENVAVRNAAAIIAVSNGVNDLARHRYPEISSKRFFAIPYGVEPGDFEVLRNQSKPCRQLASYKENLNVCYAGAMLPKAYDTLRTLFRAVRKLRDTDPRAERFRFHFYGTTYATGESARLLVLPTAREEGVEDMVIEHPERIPYLDALRLLLSADLLLALGSSDSYYAASKIFPILLARRPVLAILHDASSVHDIMRRAGSGRLIVYNDKLKVETCKDAIVGALREFLDGNRFEINDVGVEGIIRDFSAREMTRLLAHVLDEAV